MAQSKLQRELWLKTAKGLAYKASRSEYDKTYRASKKLKVLEYYSKTNPPSCACCGETVVEFLQIDHIDGYGGEIRKSLPKGAVGSHFYDWLIENEFPDLNIRVLCSNCNKSKGSRKYCQHELDNGISISGELITESQNILIVERKIKKNLEEISPQYFKNREKKLFKIKELNIKIKLEVLQKYSQTIPNCKCCEEDNISFLSIDHINGDGAKHRRKIKNETGTIGGSYFYRYLKNNNFPNDPPLQVLCYNCNTGKLTNGFCPHLKRVGDD